jgi:hypothetical protein
MPNDIICDWEITLKNSKNIKTLIEKNCKIIDAIERCEANIRIFDYQIINIRKI